MAQLPPKSPSMMTTQNWPGYSTEKITNDAANGISWVDDFLDFSSSRRGSHRRSISDSIAFLETPMVEECRRKSIIPGGDQFERFDDEQLMSMFVNDPSSPSDPYSLNGEDKSSPSDQLRQLNLQPKNEPTEEDDSSCKFEGQNGHISASQDEDSGDKISDPKRIKRILANRQSAQRSRVRKLQYITELERNVSSLQAEVSVLSPRVAFLDHQRLVLNVDNSVLKQRIAALAQDKLFKDAHQEALKSEIERLKQIYCQQNRQKMENSPQIVTDISAEKEQLAV